MIINIHGLFGQGENSKFQWLRANFPELEVVSPTIDYLARSPESVLASLAELAESALKAARPGESSPIALGSSLGGFFARCLNLAYPQVGAILINPCLAPFLSLRDHLDAPAYLRAFAPLAYADDQAPPEALRLSVLAGGSDELLNHELLTRPLLPKGFDRYHVIAGGEHRLELAGEASAILASELRRLLA
jgi:predicted esterase YcpF (UPF0227 family)